MQKGRSDEAAEWFARMNRADAKSRHLSGQGMGSTYQRMRYAIVHGAFRQASDVKLFPCPFRLRLRERRTSNATADAERKSGANYRMVRLAISAPRSAGAVWSSLR